MAAKKLWDQLAPATRARRFEVIAANHLPVEGKRVVSMAQLHAKCANGAACTGPGCRRNW